MLVYQDINDANHGFASPYRGIMPSVEQKFTLTINPCPVDNYQAAPAMQDIIYRIPEASITKGTMRLDAPYLPLFSASIAWAAAPGRLARWSSMPADVENASTTATPR